jgi:hypothetical protein
VEQLPADTAPRSPGAHAVTRDRFDLEDVHAEVDEDANAPQEGRCRAGRTSLSLSWHPPSTSVRIVD